MAETFETLKTKMGDWLAVDTTRLPDSVRGDFINLIQRRVLRKHDLRFGEITDTLSVLAGTANYTLPTRWRSPLSLWYQNPVTESRIDLVRRSKDEFDALHSDSSETGTTSDYAIWGDTLYLGPTPDQPLTLNRNYYQFLPDLADGSPGNTNEFVEQASDVLFFGAMEEASKYLLEDQRAGIWAARFTELESDLASEHQREKSVGRVAQSREPG